MARPRHAPGRSRRTWPQRLVLFTGALLTSLCLAAASAVGYVYWKLGKLVTFDDLQVDQPAEPGAPRNYLLVGSDSRENIDPNDPDYGAFLGDEGVSGKRSDTIILVRVDPAAQTVDMLSFPRDLWVQIPGKGQDRINTAYGQGRQALIDTIRQNFNIDVHHYIEVDFRGFEGLVNAVNGVSMYFETAMRDESSGLYVDPPGCVRLTGDQALAFARSRHLEYQDEDGDWHTDPTGDLGRITRQQVFIERAVDQALASGYTDPVRLNRLLDVVIDNVGVDASLRARDLLNLARQFKAFSGDQLRTHALPVDDRRTAGGAAVLDLKTVEAQPIFNIFRGLPPGAVAEPDVTVRVLNGTGGPRQAGDVTDALAAVGFQTGAPADSAEHFIQTTVRYAGGSEFAADLLARHLTSGAVLEVDPSLDANELVLITGDDLTTVMQTPRPPQESTTTSAAPTTASTSPPGSGSTTTAGEQEGEVPETTTTLVGVAPGEPPAGVAC